MLLELSWALGRLRYQPARPWLAALLAALGAARAALSAQQLGLLAWALAAMQVRRRGGGVTFMISWEVVDGRPSCGT